jgi:hypothetical protein
MCRDFGGRENSRVRDLVDLVIFVEHGHLDPAKVAAAARQVWHERGATVPPAALPTLPPSWPDRYERFAADNDLHARSFDTAVTLVGRLWADMFPNQET